MAAILPAELIAFASIADGGDPPGPTDDTGLTGGAIDTNYRVIFEEQIGATAFQLEAASSSGSDTTQELRIIARHTDGSLVTSNAIDINGTTQVSVTFPSGGNTVLNIMSVFLDGTAVGDITIRDVDNAPDIIVIPAGELGAIRLFRNSTSVEGSVKTRFEKIFLKNTNGANALTSAVVSQTADPSSSHTFALAATKDDTAGAPNRLVDVAALLSLTFDTDDKSLLGALQLLVGESIGVWVKQIRTDGQAPIPNGNDSVTHQLAGDTGAA